MAVNRLPDLVFESLGVVAARAIVGHEGWKIAHLRPSCVVITHQPNLPVT